MKSKLLIVGAEGFIGSFLADKLSYNYDVSTIIKGSLNVLDLDSVTNFLKDQKFEVIINCLTFGGKEKVSLIDPSIVDDNLRLFNNFLLNSDKFSHFINIGSGSEFDTSTNIENASEVKIFDSTPRQSYSYSKNIIARSVFYNNKFTTLRLFGCFGKNEPNIRLLKKYTTQPNVTIVDRYFDFISIEDFFIILQYVLQDRITGFDVNCVHTDKIKLSTFLETYDRVFGRTSSFVIDKISDLNYTGNGEKLSSLNLKLYGIEESFRKFYG